MRGAEKICRCLHKIHAHPPQAVLALIAIAAHRFRNSRRAKEPVEAPDAPPESSRASAYSILSMLVTYLKRRLYNHVGGNTTGRYRCASAPRVGGVSIRRDAPFGLTRAVPHRSCIPVSIHGGQPRYPPNPPRLTNQTRAGTLDMLMAVLASPWSEQRVRVERGSDDRKQDRVRTLRTGRRTVSCTEFATTDRLVGTRSVFRTKSELRDTR